MIDQVHRYLEGALRTFRLLLPLLTLVEVVHARPLASQEGESGRTLAVTLSEAIADSNHDFVPDQLGRSLSVTGIEASKSEITGPRGETRTSRVSGAASRTTMVSRRV